ncbi:zinc-dependent peptidase [Halioxenophilus sp. WMMB6]|uniref:M90 family metallopeptidase n=1 Tax=Halioxenophilus sp. WMMB6 TaxID=3073815 RepID=UPI00295E2743|nr:zinc-dependent peptidase [Halioxenophilus sp. WMMB6]
MMQWLKNFLLRLLALQPVVITERWQPEWSTFLQEKVSFYRHLRGQEQTRFNQRALLFLHTTRIESGQLEVTDFDRLLVAASAIIPVWAFPKWHYLNLEAVFLLPGAFNQKFECGQPDSLFTGMVGTGPMSGKMALSQPHLHLGFDNSRDKHNVGIHEFIHLIDMADGDCDGFPESLRHYQYAIPWFDLVEKKTREILLRKSNIPDYGASNKAEFFAVASEYFFERPGLLARKHPKLYHALSELYQQDTKAIARELRVHKKALCPCGSGKRYKHCCMPKN